ncbi:hypothetical protein [Nocardia bovistercoris]|uniref:Uncharacterized protein n=1 Tax=Nocardia bovistercoris TaxID=2785916 RepID=A0A931N4Z0_9NOCA|nr:hypothetical protein [Nocardia bovistercoris]MBH0778791.1 hypothetical protein [Nocardia bovistercoris]
MNIRANLARYYRRIAPAAPPAAPQPPEHAAADNRPDFAPLKAVRDEDGHIRLKSGQLIALEPVTREYIQHLHDHSVYPDFRAEYRAALDLLDRETTDRA